MGSLILASGSEARRRLLAGAGVDFTVETAPVDEGALKAQALENGLSTEETALKLAVAKARAVSECHVGAWVLGADQMLDCNGDRFDKPGTREKARAQLQDLRGRSHTLISATACVRDGVTVWQTARAARLTLRDFDDAELDAYLDACGDEILGSVGAYHVEGRGARLFQAIDGDHYTIQGLPLLDVLAFLRSQGMI